MELPPIVFLQFYDKLMKSFLERKIMAKIKKPNWENRTLFHGDNLDVLREMNSQTVDLIATDPPFNKGRDFHATPDSLADGASFQDRWSWEEDVHPDWIDKLEDDWAEVAKIINLTKDSYGEDMAAFLCFMAVRLIEMHRILKPTGSIYLHCDPTASHYLKLLLDAVFGSENFGNEITWKRSQPKGHAKRNFANSRDIIFRYTKSDTFTFNPVYKPLDQSYIDKFYRFKDADGRIYQLADLTNPNKNRPNLTYEFLGIHRVWRWTRDRMQEAYDAGLVVQPKAGVVPRYKRYLDQSKGAMITDNWDDIEHLHGSHSETTGYPTQKPLPLYQRMIKASSNKGDIVLDPFCGCATTLVAAEMEGREWVGIDIWDKAHKVVVKRLVDEGLLKDKASKTKTNLAFGEVDYTKKLPKRTDDKKEAVPFLRTKEVIDEPKGKKMSRVEMMDFLIKQHGCKCQGCNRRFDDERYLELDHNVPRSDGGINHITNRVLLCSPCNKLKSNTLTLSGLKRKNKKEGYMQDDE